MNAHFANRIHPEDGSNSYRLLGWAVVEKDAGDVVTGLVMRPGEVELTLATDYEDFLAYDSAMTPICDWNEAAKRYVQQKYGSHERKEDKRA